MKKLSLGLVLGIMLMGLFAFKMAYEPKKLTAEVEQINGMYVFIHSKPVMEYEVLGTYAPTAVWSKNASPIIEHMVKKGKERYPTADGIVFKDDELGKAELIKFK